MGQAMTKTFRDEETGERYRYHSNHCWDRVSRIIIEPIPKPPQTEAEILREMDLAISAAEYNFASRCRAGVVNQHSLHYSQEMARAIVAAVLKIVEAKK